MAPCPLVTPGTRSIFFGSGILAFLLSALSGGISGSPEQEPPSPSAYFTEAKTVVLLGNGLIEESQSSAYIETRLTRHILDRRIIFRNLGWTGDTVWARARTSGYQNPSGLDRLKKQTAELKPDLLIVGYGLSESFEGAAGLEKFKDGLGKLLDLLAGITPRLVLLSPAPHEDLGRPYPDPAEHNKALESYAAAIREIASRRHLPFVDLLRPLEEAHRAAPAVPLTTNGILLNDAGYWRVALEIERQLGLSRPPWEAELSSKGAVKSAQGARISDVAAAADSLQWKLLEDRLPSPLSPPAIRGATAPKESTPLLKVGGLAEGEWILRMNGQEIVRAPARSWESGVSLRGGPSFDQVEALRRLIAKRNNLFTRRWRPINDWPAHYTYLAPDFALYDGLVTELDESVATQSKPVIQSCSLVLKKP